MARKSDAPARRSNPNRGGKREGSGVKASDPANPLRLRLTITLSETHEKRLAAVLKGRKRSEFARQCLLAGIEAEEIRARIYREEVKEL